MKERIICPDTEGNDIFHITLYADGSLQPIISAKLRFDNTELLQGLLGTDRLGGTCYDREDGRSYLFMYDNNSKRPYPSVMIWRNEKYESDTKDIARFLSEEMRSKIHGVTTRRIVDMRKEDLSIIQYAVDNYLKGQAEDNG